MEEKYTFTCSKCGHKFIPDFLRWFISPHIFSLRYFRCDKCGKLCWMRRKDKDDNLL